MRPECAQSIDIHSFILRILYWIVIASSSRAAETIFRPPAASISYRNSHIPHADHHRQPYNLPISNPYFPTPTPENLILHANTHLAIVGQCRWGPLHMLATEPGAGPTEQALTPSAHKRRWRRFLRGSQSLVMRQPQVDEYEGLYGSFCATLFFGYF
jgi:hypothetical protein